jgi:fumarate hydratase class II
MDGIMELAIGGTAVGTGINAPKNFSDLVCKYINEELKTSFRPHPNKFAALSAHDEIVHLAGTLDTLAGSLMKIANDIRWLSSGPRCGLGELSLPENEPGSSIMPGKVNPTQCEALTMVAVQVKGYVNAISIAGSQGNFQLNVFKPMMIFNISQAIYIMSDSMNSFAEHCIKGITPNAEKIDHLMKQSLMLVTALTPKIGYYKAAQIAQNALEKGQTLKESCVELEHLTEDEFEKIVDPSKMV